MFPDYYLFEFLPSPFLYNNMFGSSAEQQKLTVRVSKDAFPETVVGEAIGKKSKSFRITREQQIQLIEDHQKNFVLKVCGTEEYLLERYPICQYKVRHFSIYSARWNQIYKL